MSFKPITEGEFKARFCERPKYKVESDVADFLVSGSQYGQLDTSEYSTATSLCSTYINAIKRMGLKDQIKIIKRGDDVFICKVINVNGD